MNTKPENSSNDIEANVQSGITRRSFVKRTGGSAIAVALALEAFRVEALAGGSASLGYTLTFSGSSGYVGGAYASQEAADAALAAMTGTDYTRSNDSETSYDDYHKVVPKTPVVSSTTGVLVSPGTDGKYHIFLEHGASFHVTDKKIVVK